MTFREGYNTATTWQRKVVIISLYHYARLSQNKDWKLINSANYFNVSISLISENLNLSSHFDEIKECGSRNQALKRLKE